MKRIEFHILAKAEYEAAIKWYESEKMGLGVEFRQEVEATLTRIRENPEFFVFVSKNNRLGQVHRFRYGIIYQIRSEQVFVLALSHLHRDPDYWKDRE